jgi:GTPase SAR1 family protein
MSTSRTIKKLIFAGDGAVGKTTTIAILAQYFKTRFESTFFKSDQPIELEEITRTRMFDFHTLQFSYKDRSKEILQIWDLQGQRFSNPNQKTPTNPLDLIPGTIVGHTSLVVLMFSMNDYASFDHLFEEGGWYDSIKDFIEERTDILLIGNKNDLEQEVYDNIIDRVCKKLLITKFIKLSALEGENIEELADFVYLSLFADANPLTKEFVVEKGTSIYLE